MTVTPDLDRRFREAAATLGLVDIGYDIVESPIGELLVAASDRGVASIWFDPDPADDLDRLARIGGPRVLRSPRSVDHARRELDEYFRGERRAFDLPLDRRLSRGFQRTVLEHLPDIGYGATASYAAVALASSSPRAVRAVGTACATNPLPVVVPCHRVVRSDGTAGNYRGGMAAKQILIDLEARA